jgi:hypothetical protein
MRLTGRQAGRVWVVRQDGTALGRRHGSGAADARGPLGLGLLSGLLTGRQAGRVWVERQDGTALGRRHGSGAADARGPLGLRRLCGLLT